MHALQAAFKVFLEIGVRLGCRTAAGDHNVVVIRLGEFACQLAYGMLQPPPDTIANHGIADFLGDRKAEPRLGLGRTDILVIFTSS